MIHLNKQTLLALLFTPLLLFGREWLDWNAHKHEIGDSGVTTSASYTENLAGNPYGGNSQGFTQAGSLDLAVNLDLEKAAGFCGWELDMTWVIRSGQNLTTKKIGNAFFVQQVYSGETYQLDLLYLQKRAFHDRLSFKFGRLEPGNDFATSPLYSLYMANSINGNPGSLLFNVFFTTVPQAVWGTYLDFLVTPEVLAKFAVYCPNPDVQKSKYHGFNFQLHSEQGAELHTEWVYLHDQKREYGYPGNYTAGAYYYTGHFPRWNGGKVQGNYGYYILMDQMVYRKGARKVTPWAAALYAPKDRNLFPLFFDAGLILEGVNRCRPKDFLVFGVAYGGYSGNIRAIQKVSKRMGQLGPYGDEPQFFEINYEVNYGAYFSDNCLVQPVFQYIVKPSGKNSIPNATVFGAQIAYAY